MTEKKSAQVGFERRNDTIETHNDMFGFFQEQLSRVLSDQSIEIRPEVELYLLELLTNRSAHAWAAIIERPLGQWLLDATREPNDLERFRSFRSLGDASLYAGGFCSDYFQSRGISTGYLTDIGAKAYSQASNLLANLPSSGSRRRTLFQTLAEEFSRFVAVIDEVREHTALRTPQEIVKLYDRWRRTGSRVLARRLHDQGVFPQHGDSTMH